MEPTRHIVERERHQHRALLVTYTDHAQPEPRAGAEGGIDRYTADTEDVGDPEIAQHTRDDVVAAAFARIERLQQQTAGI